MIEQSVHEMVNDSVPRISVQLPQNTNLIQKADDLQNNHRKSKDLIPNKIVRKTIKISVDKCSKEQKSEPVMKQCRICLQGQQEGRMIRPCMCSGSVTYAHQKCITQWIKRKHDPKVAKCRLECQMCSTPFKYKSAKRRTLDSQQFYNNYQKEKRYFILFYMLVSVLFLTAIGIITIIVISGNQTDMGLKLRQILVKSENIKIIYICVVFILFIVLMFLIILFIIQYAVKSELVISEVMNYSDPNIKKKYKIYPRMQPKQ